MGTKAAEVALGSLLVTVAFSGVADVAVSVRGMPVGAAAFTAYCLAAVPLMKRGEGLERAVRSRPVLCPRVTVGAGIASRNHWSSALAQIGHWWRATRPHPERTLVVTTSHHRFGRRHAGYAGRGGVSDAQGREVRLVGKEVDDL
jgi:hypothetical protein